MLAGTESLAWVVDFFVWEIWISSCADLCLEAVVVLCLIRSHAIPKRSLCVGVDIHFDDAVVDRFADVSRIRARSAVKHKRDRVGGYVVFLFDIALGVGEDVRFEDDIAGFVDAVDIAKCCGDEEVRADCGECIVCTADVFWLGVEQCVVDVRVVDAVFFAARDADLGLEHHAEVAEALEVVSRDADDIVEWFDREVEHV